MFVVALLGLLASCAPTQQPAWKLVWEDDFNQDTLDGEIWSEIPRGTSDWNNYMSAYDSCYALRDGNLILRGMVNTSLPDDTAAYLTGGVYTKGKKTFTNGRLSIRAKMQATQGSWPAFWMLPEKEKWPMGGEIDIVERLSFDNFAYQTIHSHYTQNLKMSEYPMHYSTGGIDQDDYNVYTVEMYTDSLRFFINDHHTFTYPRIETDKEGQFPFTQPFFLLVDMQLGGKWVGAVDPSGLPIEVAIDWVRFYQKKAD